MHFTLKFFCGFILYSITVWTIIGNIFILIALSSNKQLKKNGISNILIGNLAFSDLLLGLAVLPFSATFSTFKFWIFGEIICNIWLQIDVLLCTASIWGLTMISIDRYIATNHPIKYRIHKNNPKIGIAYISTAWLISFLISLGPLFFYNIETNDTFNKTKVSKRSSLKLINNTNSSLHTCVLFHETSFVVLSSLGSFYFPLLIMIILYSKVFFKIRSQNNFRNISISQRRNEIEKNRKVSETGSNKVDLNEPLNNTNTNNETKIKTLFHAETRITKTLSIIMTCFVACWLPFFIVYIVRSFLKQPQQVDFIMDYFVWLGYLNSALNPVLYLVLNKNFRDSFNDIIKFKCLLQNEQQQIECNRRTSRL